MTEMNAQNEMKLSEQKTENTSTEHAGSVHSLAEAAKLREKKQAQLFRAPLPGYVWNPLRKLSPNIPCPCLSKKKFKKCCLDKLPPAVPDGLAKQYERQIALGTLVFLTEENQTQLKDMMPPELWAQKQAELELQLKERMAPLTPKDAWECSQCKCSNAGELDQCADCGIRKPEVKTDEVTDAKPTTA